MKRSQLFGYVTAGSFSNPLPCEILCNLPVMFPKAETNAVVAWGQLLLVILTVMYLRTAESRLMCPAGLSHYSAFFSGFCCFVAFCSTWTWACKLVKLFLSETVIIPHFHCTYLWAEYFRGPSLVPVWKKKKKKMGFLFSWHRFLCVFLCQSYDNCDVISLFCMEYKVRKMPHLEPQQKERHPLML